MLPARHENPYSSPKPNHRPQPTADTVNDPLWAPWRHQYVVDKPPPPPGGPECFVCRALADSDDRANLVVKRGEHAAVILNRFPYNNGHLLIVPNAHKAHPRELTDAENAEITRLINTMIDIIEEKMNPQGFNVGLNLGRVAGAGLPGHLHWHVVPRWAGDTNFMPVLADTSVIVQSLDSLFDLLRNDE